MHFYCQHIFFKHNFCYQAVWRDQSNRRLYEHGICIRHCQDSNSQPVPSLVRAYSTRPQWWNIEYMHWVQLQSLNKLAPFWKDFYEKINTNALSAGLRNPSLSFIALGSLLDPMFVGGFRLPRSFRCFSISSRSCAIRSCCLIENNLLVQPRSYEPTKHWTKSFQW